MLKNIQHINISDASIDSDNILHSTLISLTTIGSLIVIASFILPNFHIAYSILGIGLILLLLDWLCLYIGDDVTTGYMIIFSVWAILTLNSTASIGIYSTSFEAYIIVILVTVLLTDFQTLVAVVFLTILSGLVLIWFMAVGWIPEPQATLLLLPIEVWFIQSLIFILTGFFGFIIRFNIDKSQNEVQGATQLLAKRTEELLDQTQERFRIESELQKSERQYRRVVEDQTDMIVRYKPDGTRIFVNAAYCNLLGKSRDKLIGTSWFTMLEETQSAALLHQLQSITSDNDIVISEENIGRPDGTIGNFLWTNRGFFNEKGEIVEYQSVGRDITDRVQLAQKQVELEVMREKSEFMEEFVNNVTHDLKTPLSIIQTGLHLIGNSDDKDYQHKKIKTIQHQVSLLDKMINDILTFSRLGHGKNETHRDFDLNSILMEISMSFEDEAMSNGIALVTDLASERCMIHGDYKDLYRVAQNLIENAVKYTGAGGTITVRSELKDPFVYFEVADTGIGISENDLQHIFENFFRADNARQHSGTGLGLAIVKKIIDLHGGQIAVTSQPDKGTMFLVTLAAVKP